MSTRSRHADTTAFDVTGELMPSWVEGVDPEPKPDARAPPNDRDGLDPPSPDFQPDEVAGVTEDRVRAVARH